MAPPQKRTRNLSPAPTLGIVLALVATISIAALASRATRQQAAAGGLVTHTLVVRERLARILGLLTEAESAQRGFVLTGDESYAQPFEEVAAALPAELSEIKGMVADNPAQAERVGRLEVVARSKLLELRRTVDLRRQGKTADAMALVRTGYGKSLMDQSRALAVDISADEARLLDQRWSGWQANAAYAAYVILGGAGVLFCLILAAGVATDRELRRRARQAWLRTGQMALGEKVLGAQSPADLSANVLQQLAEYLDARVGALYLETKDGHFERTACYAFAPEQRAVEARFSAGQGVLGQAVADRKSVHLQALPPDYLRVSSALGNKVPLDVIVAPMRADNRVNAVVELAFMRRVDAAEQELLALVAEPVGIALQTAQYRNQLVTLLRQTQEQAEELQVQQEELRASNEELEAQSRTLRDSQGRLESQQTELEQINVRLREQTMELEQQASELLAANDAIADKNVVLERATRYKNEFLANMSHELRTPLNSSLILAKLLADNKGKNLTAEQVHFAETIHSAGNDLLQLINDILDLAKIEAGKIDLRIDPIELPGLFADLERTFRPLADDKGLRLAMRLEPGAPPVIDTDRQRLVQILTNLLSNALKFTDRGEIVLTVARSGDEGVTFTVRDTGAGIAEAHHREIFEAFRQLEGGDSRRYGGTGLGLSIAKNLAQRLGGEILVDSAPGRGSTFSLTLPRSRAVSEPHRSPVSAAPAPLPSPVVEVAGTATFGVRRPPLAATPLPERKTNGARRLLVVEDDATFAGVLSEVGRELGFTCAIACTADEAVAAASDDPPTAVLLDLRLPDHSGLSVLDRLKRNPATRHVPVQVVSAMAGARLAMEMGAVGYLVKPVTREQIAAALKDVAARVQARVQRVLVVEDDPVQSDGVRQLLSADSVEVVVVDSARDALERLRDGAGEAPFGCMVLDLKLPDATGYELLETMAADQPYAFPPVIVHTARSLTTEEEEKLRRYSRSIIIKGARSPERLLDEVTLFLHQAEATLDPDRKRLLRLARDREVLFEGRKILVVEDDVRSIFALSKVLESKGAKVAIARNGREALEHLDKERTVDLVLMDIMMPEMNGLEAIGHIRARPNMQKLPIIALTAKAMRDDQERCLQAGANDYMAKPIDPAKLLSLIKIWLPQ